MTTAPDWTFASIRSCTPIATIAALATGMSVSGCVNRPPRLPFRPVENPVVVENPIVESHLVQPARSEADGMVPLQTPEQTLSDPGAGVRSILNLRRDPSQLPTEFRELSLDETLAIALSNVSVLRDLGATLVRAPQSAPSSYDPLIQASDPLFGSNGTLSEYDPRWFGQLTSANNDRVFNNQTLGGGATQLVQDLANARSGISKRNWSGSVWELSQQATYDANNRLGNLFPNTWEQTLEASWRQPLLRGAGKEFNAIAGPDARPGLMFSNGYWIAQLRENVSQAEFEQRLQDYLQSVEEAYWQLYLAYQRHRAMEQSSQIAEQVYRTVLARYEAGLEGGEADREAEARASMLRFKQLLHQSVGSATSTGPGIYAAELTLRRLIGFHGDEMAVLRPIDAPPGAPISLDLEGAREAAFELRAELRQQRLRIRQEELRLLASKNFALPQADLISRYRLRGFGNDWWGNGPRFSSAWQDVASLDHQEWEFGVEVGNAVGQRQARQSERFARLQLAKAHAILAEQEISIGYALQETATKIGANYHSMRLGEQVFLAARQRLDASSALFFADKVQLDRVREAQEAWQQAAEQWELARVEYARSLRQIQFESGQYLSELNIRLPSDSPL